MSMEIREADVVADRERIVPFLAEHLNEDIGRARYDWLYVDNPAGKARAWLGFENDGTTLMGVAAAFPRPARRGGRELSCWCLADFVVHPEYRSLGPALQLQKACLQPVRDGEIDLCYDHPSRSMQAIYGRLKVKPYGEERRMARPVRADRVLRSKLGAVAAVPGVVGCANALLAIRDALSLRTERATSVDRVGASFGDEFSRLDSSGNAQCTRLSRTAEYLNWRYRADPRRTYEVLAARRGGELDGYMVSHRDAESVVIDELEWGGPASLRGLLAEASRTARVERVSTLSFPVFCREDGIQPLTDLGFRQREEAAVVVYSSDDSLSADVRWVTSGDRLG